MSSLPSWAGATPEQSPAGPTDLAHDEHQLAQRAGDYVTAPHQLFARLRDRAPVRRVVFDGVPAWLVTRHEDIRQVATDPCLSNDPRRANPTARRASWVYAGNPYTLTGNMLRSDPPHHTRLRRKVAAEFHKGRIDRLRPRIRQITGELVTGFLPTGRADLVTDFAQHLPLAVISELLGVPAEESRTFAGLARIYVEADDGDSGRLPQAMSGMRDYLRSLLDRKRRAGASPTAGLLDRLATEDRDPDPLATDELAAMAFLLMIAGFETTTNLIGNGLLSLLHHPQQLNLLRHRPALIGPAVEEILRYESPVKAAPVLRFTTGEIQVGGVRIPGGGEAVLLVYGAANRDPDRFPDPDRFDILRDSGGHFGFGHGPHRCLGATLGKTEAEIAIETVLTRCADLTPAAAPADLVWSHSRFMRGLKSLPVTFRPVQSSPRPSAGPGHE